MPNIKSKPGLNVRLLNLLRAQLLFQIKEDAAQGDFYICRAASIIGVVEAGRVYHIAFLDHYLAIKRPDGTTAAGRFFAQPHPSLFEQVLERMPWPARPARRRPPGEAAVPHPCGGLAIVDQSTIKAEDLKT